MESIFYSLQLKAKGTDEKWLIRVSPRQCNTSDTVAREVSKPRALRPGLKNNTGQGRVTNARQADV